MENPVIIFGATGIGKVALDIFTSKNIITYCFLDDDSSLHDTEINEISVMGSTKDDGFLKYIGKKCEAFVAVEESSERKRISNMLKQRRKVMPVNAIHDQTIISKHAFIGYGNLINAGAIVNSGAKVPNHCIIHSNAVIEYDVQLEDFVQVGAGSIIGPKVTLGEGALIGAGATIAAGIKIGKRAQIAPGSVVLKNVEADDIVFGNPAGTIEKA
ncbi:NeuD/PglB/VioB family sugar acetyltransferase [Chondrinema litorale]|uniref:NeuD/PglB/VioB family sugar acetyltransferase n=1 Tax=Chondrinema litorale TaxID=2994555 RepID=UPI0025429BB0|nr:NeuD/PglB/VioB family sugar acetyltransferase [Chondrinema litorale]UZR95894.1 NeuD/PglB/VioB family sugar acetyltransferase [Chondrinema litorale]